MATFNVYGPYEIPCQQSGKDWRSKYIDTLGIKGFWENEAPRMASMKGCYIFAMRAGPGYMPYYVGKAEKTTFQQECFGNFHENKHYNPTLRKRSGTAVMFFISQGKGPWNKKQIGEIEKYLIAEAETKNPDLTNVKGRKAKDAWVIKGAVGSKRGKPTKEARMLRKMIAL